MIYILFIVTQYVIKIHVSEKFDSFTERSSQSRKKNPLKKVYGSCLVCEMAIRWKNSAFRIRRTHLKIAIYLIPRNEQNYLEFSALKRIKDPPNENRRLDDWKHK